MNRRLFGVRAQVRGRRLERLIAELNRRGVRIYDMRRGSLRTLDFCIRRRVKSANARRLSYKESVTPKTNISNRIGRKTQSVFLWFFLFS